MIKSGYLKTLLISAGIVAIQIILLRHLTIFGAESDLVLLFLIWLCTQRSRIECLVFAAVLGFMQDALTDFWGVHMFAKVLTVFIIHNFLNRISGNKLLIWQTFLILLGIAFVHNLIMLFVTLFSDLYASDFVFLSLLFAGSIFTAVVGSFLQLVRVDS